MNAITEQVTTYLSANDWLIDDDNDYALCARWKLNNGEWLVAIQEESDCPDFRIIHQSANRMQISEITFRGNYRAQAVIAAIEAYLA